MVSPGTRVIGSCVCDTPLSLSSALLSQVYLGSAQRRERNPLGRGDWAQEGGGVSFLSLWLHFSRVMDGPSKGSRRSRQRQSQWNADLLRNVAVLLYCTCLFLFFFCPAVLCQSLVCLAAAQCTHVCMLLLKPPCKGIFERTKWEIICLYEWKGAKCLHSLVVTARFIAPSGGKHGGRENKWLALEGSYFTHAKTYWASLIIRWGGICHFCVFFFFFGKLPYSCWKKVFWLRQRLSWNTPACDTVVLFNPVGAQRIGRGFRRWSQTWPTRTLTGVFFLLLIRPGTDSCHVCEALTSPPGLNSAFGWIGTWNYYHHHGCGVYFKKLLVYMCLSVK